MIAYIRIGVGMVMVLWAVSTIAQSRTQLEDERNRIIEQIERTSKNLAKTESNKNATLADLKSIENQIKNRKSLIKNIQEQIKSADLAISDNNGKITALNQDLVSIQDQYRTLARKLYIRNLANNQWAYIFSSSNVNEAFLRWRYVKQFEAYIQQKTMNATKIRGNINNQNNSIKEEKTHVELLLKDEKKNAKKLDEDLKKKDEILKKLKQEESKLKSNLKKQKKQREKLNDEIESIIVAQLSKKKTTASGSEKYTGVVAKNKLFWPGKGYVSGKFGKQPHPTIKNVSIQNNGIDITCAKSGPVSAVAKGKVVGITPIPGYDNMVIIRHGNYYSVYSKVKHVIVKVDEEVQSGQSIGRLADTDAPELHFEFWKGKEKLNPEIWLRKK